MLVKLYAYNITMPPTKRSNARANAFISRYRSQLKPVNVGIEEADVIPILESRISLSKRSKPRHVPLAKEISPSSITNTHGINVHVAEVVDTSPNGYFRKLWKRFTQRNRKVVPINEGPQLLPKRLGGKTRRFHRRK